MRFLGNFGSIIALLALVVSVLAGSAPAKAAGVCTDEYRPVCGLAPWGLRMTYSNACWAKQAGAVVLHPGACFGFVCPMDYKPVCAVELATGKLTYRGRRVDPGAIRNTRLLTVEGERDDICAVGQTSAAHALCSSLRPHMKRHHLQPGVGHYGVFSGKKWQTQVYPQVRNLILAMA